MLVAQVGIDLARVAVPAQYMFCQIVQN